MSERTGGIDFFSGFVVGALVGAAAALILAPQSGEETRSQIRDRGIELREQADELSAEARKRAEQLQAQAKERATDLQSQVMKAVEEGKTAASRKKEDLLSQVEQIHSEPPEQAASDGDL